MHSVRKPSNNNAFSLPEMIVTIAVIGIMAAIAMVAYSNVVESAEKVRAEKVAAELNAAVKGFSQNNWDIPTAKDDSATTDEFKVLRTLQYKPSASLGRFDAGAPYYPPSWNPPASNNTGDFRLRWTGVSFQLLEPGVSGLGLKLAFDASGQSATPYTFPSNFKPEGARDSSN